MSYEITIPRLGWSMEVGTFVRWLKPEGALVKAGDALFELEGEKAAQDVEAVDTGILRIPPNAPKPGSIVAVGTVIGYLVAEGESMPVGSAPRVESAQIAARTAQSRSPAEEKTPLPTPASEAPAASPSVRRMAREMGLKLTTLLGSGPAGRITADDVRTTKLTGTASSSRSRISSPRARRVARELGIDWRHIEGTGREGRVRECDVRRAESCQDTLADSNAVPVTSRRRTIASRMLASGAQTAPVTLMTRVDATNLVNLRNQLKLAATDSAVPSYSDIVIKLVSLSLQQHPTLAARSVGDGWVVPSSPEHIHIGFAVDTNDGLVVPVVHGEGTLGLFELAKRTAGLIEKSRAGRLGVAEMQGGVFTITNLGGFGIDAFTPIINLPESAVLGLGRIRREAVVFDDQVVARDQLTLSLTFDHRIVDGAPAARFLQSVSLAVENPSAWLLRDNG